MATVRSSFVMVILALVAAGCEGSQPDVQDDEVEVGSTTIEQRGALAGTLLVSPLVARAGETARVSIENRGRVSLAYGLGNRFERFVDGQWKEVELETVAVPDVGLIVKPGQRNGPRHAGFVDRLELPADLEPGIYRALKEVAPAHNPGGAKLTLDAEFEVMSAS